MPKKNRKPAMGSKLRKKFNDADKPSKPKSKKKSKAKGKMDGLKSLKSASKPKKKRVDAFIELGRKSEMTIVPVKAPKKKKKK
jgi:hypothetical protein